MKAPHGRDRYSERMSAYLTSLRVPEPCPALLACWGQGTCSTETLSRLVEGGQGGGGQCEWLSTPRTCVSERSLVCTVTHLFLFQPLNGMFHLSQKPRGRNHLFKKSFLFQGLQSLGFHQILLQMTGGENGTRATAEEDPWRTRQT